MRDSVRRMSESLDGVSEQLAGSLSAYRSIGEQLAQSRAAFQLDSIGQQLVRTYGALELGSVGEELTRSLAAYRAMGDQLAGSRDALLSSNLAASRLAQ